MSDDYCQRQAAEGMRYEKAYRRWTKRLGPARRRQLKRLGLAEPDAGNGTAEGGLTQDMAESPDASVRPDPAELDGLPEKLAEDLDLVPEDARRVAEWFVAEVERAAIAHKAWLFNRLVAGFLASDNVRLSAGGLAFATNLAALNGLGTESEFARTIHVSRAAVSKATKAWQRELELVEGRHMKSRAACEHYSATARNNHWRKRKYGGG